MGAVVEHHLGKAQEVAIALLSEVDKRDDRSAPVPYARGLAPLRDGSCAPLTLLLHQRAEHLNAEPITDIPVADVLPIEEASEPGQVGVSVQLECR